MIYSQQDKKLVDQYKMTNIALRKQLNNLSNEIDRILIKRSSKIGLQKLPNVNKKITDPNIMQQQIQNLKKRLESLQHDLQNYKSKASINYYEKIKNLEQQVKDKDNSMEEVRKLIRQCERKDKIADVQASKNIQSKADKRIAKLQQQISRYQITQKQLMKEISCQQVVEQRTNGYIQQLAVRHGEAVMKRQKQKPVSPMKVSQVLKQQTSIGQQQWKDLKRQFLIFKESKQNEQFALNEQNERLRTQIKQWQKKIKDKRKRIQSVTMSLQKNKQRQSRVYSTLGDQSHNQKQGYRYRDRNNSIQYNTKQ